MFFRSAPRSRQAPRVILPLVLQAKRERSTALLDAMTYGLFPADGSAPSEKAVADIAALSAGITAVEEAEASEQASAAYTSCVLGLVGGPDGDCAR
jgi:hypothetical protein